MSRVNIEDSIFKDKRFIKLVVEFGNLEQALGSIVFVWIFAQKYWLKNQGIIPKEDWESQNFHPILISSGLVICKENGYYVCGSSEQFLWLTTASNNGKSKSLLKTKHLKQFKNESERVRTTFEICPNETEALPLSLSLRKNTYTSFPASDSAESSLSANASSRESHIILDAWNENCLGLPKAKLTTKRKKICDIRWKENPTKKYWIEAAVLIAQSDFCNARVKESKWRANFDFFIRADTAVKAHEGNYNNKSDRTQDKEIELGK